MGYTVGIDIGGSTTKIVGLREGKLLSGLMVRAGDPITSAYGAFGKFLSTNGLTLENVDRVMYTGVGSSFMQDGIFGIETQKVDEFISIGLGGRYISGCGDAVVVSMGTGTAMVSVRGDDIRHVGGTGIGGGTLLGLCRKLIGSQNIEHIVELAEQGDLGKIDLFIGDITNTKLSNMDLQTTASNFGKIDDAARPEDFAVGVLNMVFQAVGTFSGMAAKACGTKNVILTGNLSRISMMRPLLDMLELLYDVKYIIPDNSDFATAIGAAVYNELGR